MFRDTSRDLDASVERSRLGRGCRANEWKRHNLPLSITGDELRAILSHNQGEVLLMT